MKWVGGKTGPIFPPFKGNNNNIWQETTRDNRLSDISLAPFKFVDKNRDDSQWFSNSLLVLEYGI